MLSLILATAITSMISYALFLWTAHGEIGGALFPLIRIFQNYTGGFIAGIWSSGRSKNLVMMILITLVITLSSSSYYYFHYNAFRASALKELTAITNDATSSELLLDKILKEETGKSGLWAYLQLRWGRATGEISFEHSEDEPETVITVPRASFEVFLLLAHLIAAYMGLNAGVAENLIAKKQYRKRKWTAFFNNPIFWGLLAAFSSDFREMREDIRKTKEMGEEKESKSEHNEYITYDRSIVHPFFVFNAHLYEWKDIAVQIDLAEFRPNCLVGKVDILATRMIVCPLPLTDNISDNIYSDMPCEQAGSIVKFSIPSIPVGKSVMVGIIFRVKPSTPKGTILMAKCEIKNPDSCNILKYYVTDAENTSPRYKATKLDGINS